MQFLCTQVIPLHLNKIVDIIFSYVSGQIPQDNGVITRAIHNLVALLLEMSRLDPEVMEIDDGNDHESNGKVALDGEIQRIALFVNDRKIIEAVC